jgi:RNA polymerase sigma-70 factor (ECF subfamily)
MSTETQAARPRFEQLIREHGGRIRRIARRFAADGAVDDLVQDMLVRLWRSHTGFRGDAKVETWIYRVCLNAAMTHVGATVKARAVHAAAVQHSGAGAAGAPAGADAAQILTDFLERLGDIDASILMMYMDGLSAADMSGVLGISENAIHVRINRLKQKFRDAYVD